LIKNIFLFYIFILLLLLYFLIFYPNEIGR